MDVSTVGRDARLIYEAINTWINWCCDIFCIVCWWSSDMIYCDHCFFSSNCFGCIWLRNKQYCIFNKQYSKEEYEIQVPKIIAHMIAAWERGEFFHPLLSPFGYNETVAQEYFPIAQW
jgi:hypothetical protein